MEVFQVTKVLYAVWELEPFFKVGGLGEVAHSLPKALYQAGVDVRVVIPKYKKVKLFGQKETNLGKFQILFGREKLDINVYKISFLDLDIPVYKFLT